MEAPSTGSAKGFQSVNYALLAGLSCLHSVQPGQYSHSDVGYSKCEREENGEPKVVIGYCCDVHYVREEVNQSEGNVEVVAYPEKKALRVEVLPLLLVGQGVVGCLLLLCLICVKKHLARKVTLGVSQA